VVKFLCNQLLKVLGLVNIKIMMPSAQWLGARVGMGADHPPTQNPTDLAKSYVESDGRINMFLYEAASMEIPDQAVLNACMELMRGKNAMNTVEFLGHLAVTYGPEEAFCRVFANLLSTGMNMQRRLDGVSQAGAPQIAQTPTVN
jgi:hypothetical protein